MVANTLGIHGHSCGQPQYGLVPSNRQGRIYKGKGGFLLGPSGGRVGPGNCSVGRLFGDPRFVLKFLADTGVGKIKRGVIVRGEVTG